MIRTTWIYALADATGIRYVGKSDNPRRRLVEHLRDSDDNHRTRWLRKLRRESEEPQLQRLAEVPVAEWAFWETFFIWFFASTGASLVNSTTGGKGGWNASEEMRRKRSEAMRGESHHLYGKTRSPEVRAAISRALSGSNHPLFGKTLPDKHRRAISEGNKGRIVTKETRVKISKTLTGRKRKPLSPEHREKLLAARAAWVPTKEYLQRLSERVSGERHPMYGKPLPTRTREAIARVKGARPIIVVERESGMQVGRWISKRECARALGVSRWQINQGLKGKQSSMSQFLFFFDEDRNMEVSHG